MNLHNTASCVHPYYK
jgi:hypothetical protein